jgi:hypothetical protein
MAQEPKIDLDRYAGTYGGYTKITPSNMLINPHPIGSDQFLLHKKLADISIELNTCYKFIMSSKNPEIRKHKKNIESTIKSLGKILE